MALDVDAAAAGPPGELGVLPRRQVGVALAVELGQLLQHDRAGRHVDAQRQRLGGEHRLDQAGDEQFLDGLLERRQHPGVVGRDRPAPGPPATPSSRARQVGLRQVGGAPVDDRPDPVPLAARWSAACPDRTHCATAASHPAREKMKVMAGSSPVPSSRSITSTRAGGRQREPASPTGPPPCHGPRSRPPSDPPNRSAAASASATARARVGSMRDAPGGPAPPGSTSAAAEQVVQPPADQHVLPQRHRPDARRRPPWCGRGPPAARRRTPRRWTPSRTARPAAPRGSGAGSPPPTPRRGTCRPGSGSRPSPRR